MKENCLIGIVVLLLVTIWLQYIFPAQRSKQRYEIVPTATITILVDKTTGETWRNSICREDSNIPACWEKMNFLHKENFVLPVGEQRIRNKDLPKYLKEQEKIKLTEEKKNKQKFSNPAENEENILRIGN